MAVHVTELPFAGSIESTLRQGEQAGLITDADLTGSEAAVLVVIDARIAKLHVTQRALGISVKEAVKLITEATGNPALVTGGSLANIYAAIPGNWSPGFSPTL